MTDYGRLLRVLADNEVAFIVVGGIASIMHGAARMTYDVDVVYDRNRDNVKRLAGALAPLNPYLRGAPPGLPFRWDEETILRGLNFTLTTIAGDIDLLGEVAGGGFYAALLPETTIKSAYGIEIRTVNLSLLITLKRAAGRPKDIEAIAELEAIREELESNRQQGDVSGDKPNNWS